MAITTPAYSALPQTLSSMVPSTPPPKSPRKTPKVVTHVARKRDTCSGLFDDGMKLLRDSEIDSTDPLPMLRAPNHSTPRSTEMKKGFLAVALAAAVSGCTSVESATVASNEVTATGGEAVAVIQAT